MKIFNLDVIISVGYRVKSQRSVPFRMWWDHRSLHDLETRGKFTKNDKLTFISDDMLILGCDIGSETHYVRAIDSRGRELSRNAFSFSNTGEGQEW